MLTQGMRLLSAIAVLAATSTAMVSMARADQRVKHPRVAKPPLQHPTFFPSESNAWPSTKDKDGCTWPYKNQLPPCMSTWPAGDPDYHGSGAGG